MKNLPDFLDESRRLRTVARASNPNSFCLIVENRRASFEAIKKALECVGVKSRSAESIDDALGIINEESENIIAAVIGSHVNGVGTASDVVREIERDHLALPYLVYTRKNEEAKFFSKRFPRANVVRHSSQPEQIAEALGLKKEGV